MARQEIDYDNDDDNDDPDETDMDRSDADEADSVDMVACPNCGKKIYAQAEFCTHCREYVVEKEVANRKPIWFIVGAILCICIILFWIIR